MNKTINQLYIMRISRTLFPTPVEYTFFSSAYEIFFQISHMLLLLLSCYSHVRLCANTDGSPPGSTVPGILQARILEWVAIFFSNACMLSRFSHVQFCVTLWTAAHQAPLSMGFSRQEYWSGLLFPSPNYEQW